MSNNKKRSRVKVDGVKTFYLNLFKLPLLHLFTPAPQLHCCENSWSEAEFHDLWWKG